MECELPLTATYLVLVIITPANYYTLADDREMNEEPDASHDGDDEEDVSGIDATDSNTSKKPKHYNTCHWKHLSYAQFGELCNRVSYCCASKCHLKLDKPAQMEYFNQRSLVWPDPSGSAAESEYLRSIPFHDCLPSQLGREAPKCDFMNGISRVHCCESLFRQLMGVGRSRIRLGYAPKPAHRLEDYRTKCSTPHVRGASSSGGAYNIQAPVLLSIMQWFKDQEAFCSFQPDRVLFDCSTELKLL